MAKEVKSKNRKWIITGAIITVFIALLATAIAFIFSNGRETYVSQDRENTKRETIHCLANNIENAFFAPDNSTNNAHGIKIIFKDDKPYRLFYSYEGQFRDNGAAKAATSLTHANYNKYMANYGVDAEKFSPTFVDAGTMAKINLYAEYQNFNTAIAKIFFINTEEYPDFYGSNQEEVKQFYEDKDFQCNFINNKEENE